MNKKVHSEYVQKNANLLIYHYEFTNDGRRILILEPNIFTDYETAKVHKSCLEYLSGCSYDIIRESDISRLDLLLNEVTIQPVSVANYE